MLKKIILWLFFLLLFTYGIGQNNRSTVKPAYLNDGIKTAVLSKAGLNTDSLNQLTTQIASGFYPNIHSLLIYKEDKLVYENYFFGNDQKWGENLGVIEHNINDLHDVRSISKSIVSACVGIAIAQGKIESVNQKIFDFFPQYAAFDTGMKKELCIKHLLTMTSGLEWNEDIPYDNPENSEIQMIRSADPIAFVLTRRNTSIPGKEWKYNGGTTQLLAAIIEKVTGKRVDAFAKKYLFKPLGIVNFEWVNYPGTDNPAAASGLRLRPRDLLKFAILYHNKGIWDGKRIIPEDWIKQSFHPWVNQSRSNGGYGYQFWIRNDSIQKHPLKIVTAVGNGDQRIYFDEKNNLIVVTTAGNYNIWNIANDSYAILKRIYGSFTVK